MTIQEIKTYLKKHYYLMFKYQSEFYSFVKTRTLFYEQYSIIATDILCQSRNSLEELCEQVYIHNCTLLAEAIKNLEILKWDDPLWETYEAIRHSAIVHKNEIHFVYNQREYWIAHTPTGLAHLSDGSGSAQVFSSCRELFEFARINGHTLKTIWKEVVVDAC